MSFVEHFVGKRVIITGTGRGLGRALAKRLHEYGCTVYALSKTAERLKTLKEECPNIIIICVDLRNWEETRKVVEKIEPVHYLVNNAVSLSQQKFMEVTPEEYDASSDVKIKAVINVSQVVARKMIEKGIKGSIVNISSLGAFKAYPDLTSYCVMDAALNMLTKIMAVELGPKGIRVNAICPGGIRNESMNEYLEKASAELKITKAEVEEMFDSKTPLGKHIMELDVALDSILFLLSHMSPLMHGECMVVDGGYTIS